MTDEFTEHYQELPDTADSSVSKTPYSFMHQDLTPASVMVLFFVALIVGIITKLFFGSFITIGYDDYRLEHSQSNMNLTALQKNLLAQGGSLAYEPKQLSGPACPDKQP